MPSNSKKKQRQRTPAPGNGNNTGYKRLYYYMCLLHMGAIPNPAASNRALEQAVLMAYIKATNGATLDPEVPDNWLQLVLLHLSASGMMSVELVSAVHEINSQMSNLPSNVGSLATSVQDIEKESVKTNVHARFWRSLVGHRDRPLRGRRPLLGGANDSRVGRAR